jgi:hypothetical protein
MSVGSASSYRPTYHAGLKQRLYGGAVVGTGVFAGTGLALHSSSRTMPQVKGITGYFKAFGSFIKTGFQAFTGKLPDNVISGLAKHQLSDRAAQNLWHTLLRWH